MFQAGEMRFALRASSCVGATIATVALGAAGVAGAATPTGDYADFQYCPVDAPNVTTCTVAKTTSGSIKLGNTTVQIAPKTITLQGGNLQDPETFETTFVNAVGAPTLSETPLNVPGGLTGLVDSSMFDSGLLKIFRDSVAKTNDVTATAQLVGPVGYSAGAFLTQTGPAVTLPLRIKLDNPFLGSSCYIGSAASPVTFRLTTGTTAPPPPNQPITGDRGQISLTNDANLLTATGYRLVDNAFSVPGASGCGYTPLDKVLVSAAVNVKTGLPSAAGRNSAILQGNLKQASRDAVVASSQ